MPTLLHIDSSALGETSISRHLTSEFVKNWKLANPTGTVITRDVTNPTIPAVTAQWIGAVYTPEESLTAEQKDVIALSDTLVGELEAADEYVFGVPMYNFGIPATLKLWIDQIARVNKTFSYATGAPVGLLHGKKAHVFAASGGAYDAGTAMASYNFVEPYLRAVLGFLGVKEVSFLNAGGASAVMQGKIDRESFLKPHVDAIHAEFQPA